MFVICEIFIVYRTLSYYLRWKLANIVIIFDQWLTFKHASATRMKTCVSWPPMIIWLSNLFSRKKLLFVTYVTISNKIHWAMYSILSILSWLVDENSIICVRFSFLVEFDWKSFNKANHFKVFRKARTSGMPVRIPKNTDHDPNTGFYGPLINQSECTIWQSQIINVIFTYAVF